MPQLMNPFGSSAPAPRSRLAARPASLRGLRLGLLDNSKANADLLLEGVREELESQLEPSAVVRRRKPGAGVPGPEPLLEELGAQCDAVIVAVGD
jgi:hypothetical protein